MFTNPGTRAIPGGKGQEKFKNSIAVGANVSINTSSLVLGNNVANLVSNTLSVQVSNSSTNTFIIPVSIATGNTTANSLTNSIAFQVINATSIFTITPQSYSIGNTTANSIGNSVNMTVANSTTSIIINPNVVLVGNSTTNSSANTILAQVANSSANTQAGPGTLTLQGAGSNTGLTLGTSVNGASGYTWLPNGILIQWLKSTLAASTSKKITWPIAFPTGVYNAQLTTVFTTAQTGLGFQAGFVTTPNTTAVNCEANLACNVYILVIGH